VPIHKEEGAKHPDWGLFDTEEDHLFDMEHHPPRSPEWGPIHSKEEGPKHPDWGLFHTEVEDQMKPQSLADTPRE
jgi:hypothetical protein